MKILIFSFFAIVFYTTTHAQLDWKNPKNLKILKQEELRANMRAFSQSLGVRCNYCHDDSKGSRLSEIDFASDVKPTKQIARIMIKMARTINNDFISEVRKIDKKAISPGCMTCHRGVPEPKHILQILMDEYSAGGTNQSISKFDELRNRYYGSAAYDFSEGTLNVFGYQVMGKENYKDAIAIFKKNVELFPESGGVYDSLGEAYMNKGNKELAILNYEKSLELNPQNKNAVDMLEKLRKEN